MDINVALYLLCLPTHVAFQLQGTLSTMPDCVGAQTNSILLSCLVSCRALCRRAEASNSSSGFHCIGNCQCAGWLTWSSRLTKTGKQECKFHALNR